MSSDTVIVFRVDEVTVYCMLFIRIKDQVLNVEDMSDNKVIVLEVESTC